MPLVTLNVILSLVSLATDCMYIMRFSFIICCVNERMLDSWSSEFLEDGKILM